MSAQVPHRRPSLGTVAGISSRLPVSADDNAQLAGLANFANGHGGMLIPWCGIGKLLDDESATFHFYVGPKNRAVERVWRVMMRGVGSPITVVAGGAASVDVPIGEASAVYTFREPLSAKTNTAGGTSITVGSSEGGQVTVEAISMYEQTRSVLDDADYGVDLTTLRPRELVFDEANKGLRGVSDGYKNVDARRAGFAHWSTSTTSDFLAVTQAGYTDVLTLYPPALGAVTTSGTTTTTFVCAVYAKVNAGSANVRFSSTQQGSNVVNAVSGTSYAWVTGNLTINAEDLTVDDGRTSLTFESVRVEAQKGTATTLSIAAFSVIRVTSPV